jgi:hypothetical protein
MKEYEIASAWHFGKAPGNRDGHTISFAHFVIRESFGGARQFHGFLRRFCNGKLLGEFKAFVSHHIVRCKRLGVCYNQAHAATSWIQ